MVSMGWQIAGIIVKGFWGKPICWKQPNIPIPIPLLSPVTDKFGVFLPYYYTFRFVFRLTDRVGSWAEIDQFVFEQQPMSL